MNVLKKIIRNTSAQIASRIVSSATGFLITILVARHLGINGYSDLAKITALVSLCYLAIDLGANAIFLQFDEKEQNFSHFLSLRTLFALGIFLILTGATWFLPYNSRTGVGYSEFVKIGIVFFSLSFFTRAIVYTCGALFQQDLQYAHAAKAMVVGSIATLCLIGMTIVANLSLMWIVGGYVVGGFLEAVVSLYFVRKKLSATLPSFDFLKKLFFATLPLTLLLFLNLLYFRVDMILLSLFQTPSAVGLYDYAYKYFDFLIALPLFLSNSLYPILLKAEKYSRIQRKNISLYTLVFFAFGCIIVPIVWMLSPLIALVRHDFVPSILAIRILSLSLPIFFATNILQWIFITKRKQTFLVVVYALSLLFNIVLNLLFIPTYSFIASAVITDISEGLILLVMLFYVFANLL